MELAFDELQTIIMAFRFYNS